MGSARCRLDMGAVPPIRPAPQVLRWPAAAPQGTASGWLPPLRPLRSKKNPPLHPTPTLGGRPCPARLASYKSERGVVRSYVVQTPVFLLAKTSAWSWGLFPQFVQRRKCSGGLQRHPRIQPRGGLLRSVRSDPKRILRLFLLQLLVAGHAQ